MFEQLDEAELNITTNFVLMQLAQHEAYSEKDTSHRKSHVLPNRSTVLLELLKLRYVFKTLKYSYYRRNERDKSLPLL